MAALNGNCAGAARYQVSRFALTITYSVSVHRLEIAAWIEVKCGQTGRAREIIVRYEMRTAPAGVAIAR